MLQDVEKTTKIIVPPSGPCPFLYPLPPPRSSSSHCSLPCPLVTPAFLVPTVLSPVFFFTYFPSLNFIISPILPSLHHSTSPHRFYIFFNRKNQVSYLSKLQTWAFSFPRAMFFLASVNRLNRMLKREFKSDKDI